MRKTEHIDEIILTNNPFLDGLSIEVNKVVNPSHFKPDLRGVMQPVSYYSERDQSTKIYRDLDNKKLIAGLSSAAQRLYLYILYSIDTAQDYIIFNRSRYMSLNGITSINTVKKAIKELINCKIIGDSEYKDIVFYINPAIFFAGSRINKYPDLVTVKANKTR